MSKVVSLATKKRELKRQQIIIQYAKFYGRRADK